MESDCSDTNSISKVTVLESTVLTQLVNKKNNENN